ncbi:hypothetical protein Sjap_024919 [Stephania japonica]|uniref:Uncharacterized protein n=1 Tax=Stephania japonica TaxID=461633 RepID=A0AAP0EJ67_9MAGN
MEMVVGKVEVAPQKKGGTGNIGGSTPGGSGPGKLSSTGGTDIGNYGGAMKAPGGEGHISRAAFASNPQDYFADLHANEKANK